MPLLFRLLLTTLFACLLTISTPAEPLTVEDGFFNVASVTTGGALNLVGSNFTLNAGLNTGPFASQFVAGQTINLRVLNSGLDVRFGSGIINGVVYERLTFDRAVLLFESTFVIPVGTSGSFSIVTPFAFNGTLRGCTDGGSLSGCRAENVVFDSDLIGQGSVTVALNTVERPGRGIEYDFRNARYDFGSTQPVPEPTTMLLFVSGLVGVGAVVRKRRKAN